MSPKMLLHHKPCSSRLEDMTIGTFFQRVIIEGSRGDNMKLKSKQTINNNSNNSIENNENENKENQTKETQFYSLVESKDMKRILFCSGKLFYQLYHARTIANIHNITIVRIEQIAPFPFDLIAPIISKYENAELFWVQEEPKNMGCWSYIQPRFSTSMKEYNKNIKQLHYIGRKSASSPATGSYKLHTKEQTAIINEALNLTQ